MELDKYLTVALVERYISHNGKEIKEHLDNGTKVVMFDFTDSKDLYLKSKNETLSNKYTIIYKEDFDLVQLDLGIHTHQYESIKACPGQIAIVVIVDDVVHTVTNLYYSLN